MVKKNKKTNKLINKKTLLLLLKENKLKRINQKALKEIELKLTSYLNNLAKQIYEKITIKGKKTVHKKDVEEIIDKNNPF